MHSCPSMPQPNEGKTDRTIRIVLGAFLLGAALFGLSGASQVIAGLAGAVALITGLIGFCGLYKIFGISTVGKR